MKRSEEKVVSKALVGGLVGVGLIALFLAMRKKESSLEQFGHMMSHVAEILESHDIREPAPLQDLGKKIHRNESTVCAIVDWLAAGIHLWKKFKH